MPGKQPPAHTVKPAEAAVPPGGQLTTALKPLTGQMKPIVHKIGEALPRGQNDPAGQETQVAKDEAEPTDEYVPARHGVHDAADSAL